MNENINKGKMDSSDNDQSPPKLARRRSSSPGLPSRRRLSQNEEKLTTGRRRTQSPGLGSRRSSTSSAKKRPHHRRTSQATTPGAVECTDVVVEPDAMIVGLSSPSTDEERVQLTTLERDISKDVKNHKERRLGHATTPGVVAVSASTREMDLSGRNDMTSSSDSDQGSPQRVGRYGFKNSSRRIAPSIEGDSERRGSQGRRRSSLTRGDTSDEEDIYRDRNFGLPPSRRELPTSRRDMGSADLEANNRDVSPSDFPSREDLSHLLSRFRGQPRRIQSILEPPSAQNGLSNGMDTEQQPIQNAPVQNMEDWLANREAEEREDKSRRNFFRKCFTIVAIVGMLCLFVLGVVAVTQIQNNGSDGGDEGTVNPGDSRGVTAGGSLMTACFEASAIGSTYSFSQRFLDIRSVLSDDSVPNVSLMNQPNTPQRMALCWLADYDEMLLPVDVWDPDALVQRYLMALFYFTVVDDTVLTGLGTSNWLSKGHECQWRGVSCTMESNDFVTRIILNNHGLRNSIPEEIGELSNLEFLMLEKNKLESTLPSTLWDLSSLTILSVESNILNGRLPTQIGNLSHLRVFSVAHNNLSGTIPENIGRLTNLLEFSVSGNFISGTIPTSAGLLTKLNQFVLAPNRIDGTIPSEIGNMRDLQTLDIGRNSISGSIPPELGNLSNLLLLDISDNVISGAIPHQLHKLAGLTEFIAAGNFLVGPLPLWIGHLSQLVHLELYSNSLTGIIPSTIGSLQQLEILSFSGLFLSGTIPSQMGLLRDLVELHLSDAGLSGTVPTELGLLINAEFISLVGNELVGEVSPEICRLREEEFLEELEVDCAGSFPEVICGCCTSCT